MRHLTKEIIKGSPTYTLTDESGTIIATAHRVHVANGGIFSVVAQPSRRPLGIGSEAQAVAKLQAL